MDKLAALVIGPASGVSDDARALARLQLTRIDSKCSKTLAATTPMGDYTRAHLTETRARIKRALDAQRIADAPSAGAPAGFGRGAAAEESH